MDQIWSKSWIIDLLKKEGQSKDKLGHVQAVAEVALVVCDRMIKEEVNIDRKVVEAGALLHDIGLAKAPVKSEDEEFENPYPEHCVTGAKRILELGYPETVAECAQGHEQWGVEEAKDIGLPPPVVGNDYLLHSLEAQIVSFGDLALFMVVEVGIDYFDPWKDPNASAKAMLPYINACYKRINKTVNIDHPIFTRSTENQARLIKYIEPEDFPKPWEGMAKMDLSMYEKY